jgi:hypothetical protein
VPESSIVVRPEPMDSGSYTASSRLQAAGLLGAIKLFEEAANTVPLPKPPQPIVIADYGASTGHNSLLPICAAIAVLRKRTRPEHSILVAHTDVVENDFTVLFQTLEDDPDSYLKKDAASFASAIGRSFFTQILPSNSVNLGWSSWAIQWLGKVPAPVPDHLQVSYSADENVKAAYAKQAAFDWHEFVAFRGRELCPGGRLVVLTTAVGDDGEFGHRPLLRSAVAELADLVAQGLISEDEVHRMCIPMVSRRAADFLSPFAPKGRFERLEIELTTTPRLSARNGRRSRGRRYSRRWRVHSTAVETTRDAASSWIGWRPALRRGWPPNPRRCRFHWHRWCCGSGRSRIDYPAIRSRKVLR